MTAFELQINGLDGAYGTGMHRGRSVRLPGAVPGDHWLARVMHRGARADIATGIELLRPSPERAEAPCPIQSTCGACPWQTIEWAAQRYHKRAALLAALGGLVSSECVEPVRQTGGEYRYRTKSHMPIGGASGALHSGFWAPRTRELVPVKGCLVQASEVEAVRSEVLQRLNDAHVEPWNSVTGMGELRSILIRSVNTVSERCEIGVVLVVANTDFRDWDTLTAGWLKVPNITSVWLNHHPSPTNAMLGASTRVLCGEAWLKQQVGDFILYRGPTGFSQSSEAGERVLASLVDEMVPPDCGTFVDLYAGAGVFTAQVAHRVGRAILVERVSDGMNAAERSFSGASGVTTRVGDVEVVLPALVEEGMELNAVVVDPPRAGLAPSVVDALCAALPENLIYVSCQPKTLIRDLRALTASTFDVHRVVPVDMFPHTPHLEVVVHLKRGSTDA